jgi:Mn-containing catalase
LLEQFGAATGELTAALQYWVQSLHVTDPGIRDMLQGIAMEEFSDFETVGKRIVQHTAKLDRTAVYDAPAFRCGGSVPIWSIAKGAPGRPAMFKKAATLFAIFAPMSQRRPVRARRMKY